MENPKKIYKMITGPNGIGVYRELSPEELLEFHNRDSTPRRVVESEVSKLEKRIKVLEELVSSLLK